jgi:hypothetical protein
MGKEEYTIDELEKYTPKTDIAKRAKMGFLSTMKIFGIEADVKNSTIIEEIGSYVDGKKAAIEAKDKAPIDYRAEYMKDDYNNIHDIGYGNGDVMGGTPMHGTYKWHYCSTTQQWYWYGWGCRKCTNYGFKSCT